VPPRNAPFFYVDESIYSRILIQALKEVDAQFSTVGDAIPFGAPDEEWLEVCGNSGWLALTRDQRIRYRTLEKRAVRDYRVGMFTFTGGQATAQQTTDRIMALLAKFSHIASSESRPFIYTFGLIGPVARVKL
jgi:PIN like domain